MSPDAKGVCDTKEVQVPVLGCWPSLCSTSSGGKGEDVGIARGCYGPGLETAHTMSSHGALAGTQSPDRTDCEGDGVRLCAQKEEGRSAECAAVWPTGFSTSVLTAWVNACYVRRVFGGQRSGFPEGS